ncbi:MAG TPA: hypothetical protein VKA06_03420, partial [Spirochaetia bacterium]|nr:hypothetical protein [Spirochaetia bacterium]
MLPQMLWHRRSLRLRLTVVVTALIGVLFLFGTLMFIAYERRNQELLYNALHETMLVFAGSIQRELATVERVSVDVMSDEAVQQHLRSINADTPGYEWYRLSDLLARRFATHTRLPYVQAIVGVDRTGRTTLSRSDFPVLSSVLEPALLTSFNLSDESRRWTVTEPSNERLFYFRRVREIEGFGLEDLGTIVIVVEKRRLADSAVSTPFRDDMSVAVLAEGRVIYQDGPVVRRVIDEHRDAVGSSGYRVVDSGGDDYFLSTISDPARSLSYVFVVPYRLLFSGISRFNTTIAIVAAILLLAFVVISVWIARDVSAPIIQLAQRMRQVEEADFSNVDLGVNSYERPDEIGT